MKMTTKSYKVYGACGHRQSESFNESHKHNFSENGKTRIIEVQNADLTGTNDYSLVKITCNTSKECDLEMFGQATDGIFENCRVGFIEDLNAETEEQKDFWNYCANL